MKHKLGNLLMALGAALILGALALFLSNEKEAEQAAAASDEVMVRMEAEIMQRQTAAETGDTAVTDPAIPEILEDTTMTVVEIDGYGYIGYLSIPELGLELPVMADWDYSRLKVAPCRYTGTMKGGDLVVMAHNYRRHFGNLKNLQIGDTVYFTDMDGNTWQYAVAALDVLSPKAVEEVTAGEYDLTLFTCTYGGKTRVTVYCDRVTE